ncbi:MAG: hypothetical protein R3C03_04815 [Pirellulaceae bacterium]
MNRRFSEDLVSGYVDGQLTDDERALADRLMNEDAQFQAAVLEAESLSRQFRLLPKPSAPGNLKANVMSAIAATTVTVAAASTAASTPTVKTKTGTGGTSPKRVEHRWSRTSILVLAASLVGIVGLGSTLYMMNRGTSEVAMETSMDSAKEVDALAVTEDLPEEAGSPSKMASDEKMKKSAVAGGAESTNFGNAKGGNEIAQSEMSKSGIAPGGLAGDEGRSIERPKSALPITRSPADLKSDDESHFQQTEPELPMQAQIASGDAEGSRPSANIFDANKMETAFADSAWNEVFEIDNKNVELPIEEGWLVEIAPDQAANPALHQTLHAFNMDSSVDALNKQNSTTLQFYLATIPIDDLDSTLKELSNYSIVKPIAPQTSRNFDADDLESKAVQQTRSEPPVSNFSAPMLNQQRGINSDLAEMSKSMDSDNTKRSNEKRNNISEFQNIVAGNQILIADNVFDLGQQNAQLSIEGDRIELNNLNRIENQKPPTLSEENKAMVLAETQNETAIAAAQENLFRELTSRRSRQSTANESKDKAETSLRNILIVVQNPVQTAKPAEPKQGK